MRAAAFVAALLFTLGGLLIAPDAAPRAAASAGQHVMIENYAYSPATLTVQVGETVTWTNNHDEAKHDVVGAGFRSPLLAKGQSWSYTFPAAGTYSYYCSLHPDMRAKVTVTPPPQTTPAPQPAAPQPQQPTQQPQAPASSASAAPSSRAPKSSAAPSSSAPAVAAPQPVQAAPQVVPAATQSIDPMLLVAGLVTGVAVLCLLLLGGRRVE